MNRTRSKLPALPPRPRGFPCPTVPDQLAEHNYIVRADGTVEEIVVTVAGFEIFAIAPEPIEAPITDWAAFEPLYTMPEFAEAPTIPAIWP